MSFRHNRVESSERLFVRHGSFRVAKSWRRRCDQRFEELEDRRLLAGDYVNTPIGNDSLDSMLAGLAGFASWGSELSEYGEFAEPFALVTAEDRSRLAIGELLDVGDSLGEKLVEPATQYLEALSESDRDSDALVAFLGGLPDVTAVDGGLESNPTDEIRFDVTVLDDVTIDRLGVDLGDNGEALGLSIGESVAADLTVSVMYQITFGVDLDSELSSEQAFFLRDTSIQITTRVQESGISSELSIGFLETPALIDIDLDVDLTVDLNDVVPDASGNVTLSELNGYSVGTVASINAGLDSVQASLEATPTIGTWNPGATIISVSGTAIDDAHPAVVFEPNSEPLWLFNNVDADQLVNGLDLLANWLTSFSGSSVLEIDIPFADDLSLGTSIDLGQAFSEQTATARDADGRANFGASQEFSDLLGLGIDYDPATQQLKYFFDLELPSQQFASSVALEGVVASLSNFESSSIAAVSSDGSIQFDMIVDLSGTTTTTSEQMSVANLSIDQEVRVNALNANGTARCGIVGIDFANGRVTGTSGYTADIVDPFAGDSQATLNELLAGLSVPQSLLGSELQLSGSSQLDLGELTIQDSLFAFTDTPSLTVEVSDFNEPSGITVASENLGMLENLSSLTIDFLAESMTSGILGAVSWTHADSESLELVGVSLSQVWGDPHVSTRADLAASLSAIETLQEVPATLSGIPSLLSSSISMTVDESAESIELSIAAIADLPAEPLDVGLNVGALAEASGDSRLTGIGEFSGTEASIFVDVSSQLSLDFSLDVTNPQTPVAYLLDSSELVASIYANTIQPLAMSGSIGIVGLELDNGNLFIAGDRTAPNPTSPATFTVGLSGDVGGRTDVGNVNVALETSATGQMELSYRVTTQPGGVVLPDNLHFIVSDLDDVTGSTSIPESPDFPSIIAGIDVEDDLGALPSGFEDLFGTLIDATNSNVFGLGFPLIGDALAGPANFLQNIQNEVLAVLDTLPAFDASTVQVELEGVTGITSVGLDLADPDDVRFTLTFSNALFSEQISLAGTNLGLPALGASLNADILVDVVYDAQFVIGVSSDPIIGIYLDTSTDVLKVDLDVSLDTPVGQPDLIGHLGFVDVTVDNIGSDTVFHAEINLDITEPSGDDRLTVAEAMDAVDDPLSLIDFNHTGLTGGTGPNDGDRIRLEVEATVADWLPSVETTLVIDWQFDGSDLQGRVPRVTYRDVGIDLGRWFENTLGPFIGKIETFLDPVEGILDAINDPLPVLKDDPINIDTSLLDLADLAVGSLPPNSSYLPLLERLTDFAHVLTAVNNFANAVASGDGGLIVFGDLLFGANGNYDARQPDIVVDLLDQIRWDTDPWQQIEAEQDADAFIDEIENINVSAGTIDFPILDNPIGVFEWLLGFGHVEIVTWELPSVTIDIPIELSFPIIPGILKAGIFGSIEASTGITIGIDTFGFNEFQRTGELLDLLQGFYISDTDRADGGGTDVPEISIVGEALAGVAVGFDIGGVGLEGDVSGGITADINLDLLDENGDGKLRGHEFDSKDGCMEITGSIDVTLEAHALIGFVREEFPITSKTLADFNHVIHCASFGGFSDDIAALDLATGRLELYVGPRGQDRSTFPDEVDEVFDVFQEGDQIIVEAYGVREDFRAANVTLIYADAGTGNDRITIDSSVMVDADLIGGDGDDTLQGGSGNDTLDGGLHHDEIHGGAGNDQIDTGDGLNFAYGEEGNDTINGGNDVDILDGGAEQDTIRGRGGSDVILGQSGADDLQGDEGDDHIDGGSDGDTIIGNEGEDTLLGGSGDDEILGRRGNDYIKGEADDDTIDAGFGDDTVLGGGEDDEILGGNGNDLLLGEDGDDEIRGQAGTDTIEGGANNDDLFGGGGNDIILGGNGRDVIEGEGGDDLLIGGLGGDTIRGNAKNSPPLAPEETDRDTIYGGTNGEYEPGETDSGDSLFGDQDHDLIFAEHGADRIRGGDGDDLIDAGSGADRADGEGGRDTLLGGSGNDILFGGEDNDLIRGQEGDDILRGEAGIDDLFGDGGNDRIEGGSENDLIEGGQGDDHLLGQDQDDQAFGNIGNDTLEGNNGNDQLFGNSGHDVMLGDNGTDTMRGSDGNDVMRGGDGDDAMYGGLGDDLLLGHLGNDNLSGDDGHDVLRGYLGDDTIDGGNGGDRAFGEDGNDLLFGGPQNDILNGGNGDDTLEGEAGNDWLFGDKGSDILSGGLNNDFLWAGDGIGNQLNGGAGNDSLLGSDDGSEDSDLTDTEYFGDVMEGGRGNDTIDGLGGADIIDGGLGDDEIKGGTHGDHITGGPSASNLSDMDTIYGQQGDDWILGGVDDDLISGGAGTNTIDGGSGNNVIDPPDPDPTPAFSLSDGPSETGGWAELAGSATRGGLSQVGGFEEAVYAADNSVYVAWVDTRNGNSEIYLAYYDVDLEKWVEIDGSASGGGISNDDQQSRRPSIAKVHDELLVSWTSIDDAGSSTIEVARHFVDWERISNPGQASGNAYHSQLTPYDADSILMTWFDPLADSDNLYVAQYINKPGCVREFFWQIDTLFALPDAADYDLSATDNFAAVALTHGESPNQNLDVVHNSSAVILDNSLLCPKATQPHEVIRPFVWTYSDTFTDGDISDPAVALRVVDPLDGPEDTGAIDLYVAWHVTTSREDQVVAQVRRYGSEVPGTWETMLPDYFRSGVLANAESVSETIGYAAQPSLTASESEVFVAWMDDGVQQPDGGESSIYVMSSVGDDRVFREESRGDASRRGISRTGGALQSLSIVVDNKAPERLPYVAWTEAVHRPEIYVRRDLNEDPHQLIIRETDGGTQVAEGGVTDSYAMLLTSEPTFDVVVTLQSNHQIEVSPATIVFTPDNWYLSQTVMIRAIDDGTTERRQFGRIRHSIASLDQKYDGIAPSILNVSIIDND